jgi:nucleoside-diphosphate-sugar epimerase
MRTRLIIPAVEGTKRVIAVAQRARVKRLVLTSSTFAMIAGKDSGRYGTGGLVRHQRRHRRLCEEQDLAERAAWDGRERRRHGTHGRQPRCGFRAFTRCEVGRARASR